MRILILAASLLLPAAASADCTFSTSNCYTDSYGNTYQTEQNLGGGYNTYRNGSLHSQTQQDLSGGYQERYNDGSSRRYNYDPYASQNDPYESRSGGYGYPRLNQ
jgi:hypothetical protein